MIYGVLFIALLALIIGVYIILTDQDNSEEMKKVDVSSSLRGILLVIVGLVCLIIFLLLLVDS